MELKWSLDELYTSFEAKEFKEDLVHCQEKIVEIKEWAEKNLKTKDNRINKIEEYLNRLIEINTIYDKLEAYAYLVFSVDTKNQRSLQVFDKLESMKAELTRPFVLFQKWLDALTDLDDLISSSNILKKHQFYLKELAQKARYLLSEKEETLLAKVKNTGSAAWTKLQEVLSSSLMVDIEIDNNKNQLPLSVVRNMAYDKKSAIRKAAYEAELKAYKKIEVSSAASLNGIKGEVLTTSEMRGFKSPLEEALANSRMDKETLRTMLEAIKESLPIFHKYYRKKGELLNYNDGLPFYEMFAPMGRAEKKYTYEEARKFIVDNFRTFSDKLADYADHAFEKRWIDAEPREGKMGGAFCSNIFPINESRILANFTGSFSDVLTLAHELGHGYHGLCLGKESILNSEYPMPLAETASIFCETIVMNAALDTVTAKEVLTYLEQSIADSAQVIVDIYSRFLFESKVFEIRKDHSLSVAEFKEIMFEAQKEAYGDGLDHGMLHPYMWICKSHYYDAEYNFYNYPYAFGLLFAKGLYAKYLENKHNFVQEYDSLLASSGKNNIVNVAKMMEIDVTDIDFWRNSLKIIEKDIDKFMQLSN